jgi:hypothetical protein
VTYINQVSAWRGSRDGVVGIASGWTTEGSEFKSQ